MHNNSTIFDAGRARRSVAPRRSGHCQLKEAALPRLPLPARFVSSWLSKGSTFLPDMDHPAHSRQETFDEFRYVDNAKRTHQTLTRSTTSPRAKAMTARSPYSSVAAMATSKIASRSLPVGTIRCDSTGCTLRYSTAPGLPQMLYRPIEQVICV